MVRILNGGRRAAWAKHFKFSELVRDLNLDHSRDTMLSVASESARWGIHMSSPVLEPETRNKFTGKPQVGINHSVELDH